MHPERIGYKLGLQRLCVANLPIIRSRLKLTAKLYVRDVPAVANTQYLTSNMIDTIVIVHYES